MKLPWDQKYMKIAFHVVVTVIIIYVLFLLVTLAAWIVANLPMVWGTVWDGLKYVGSVFDIVIIGFVAAYLLDPLVDFFQTKYEAFTEKRHGKPSAKGVGKKRLIRRSNRKPHKEYKSRTAGAVLAFLVIFLSIAFSALFVVLKLAMSPPDMDTAWTGVVTGLSKLYDDFTEAYASVSIQLEEWGVTGFFQGIVDSLVMNLSGIIKSVSQGVVRAVSATGGVIANLFMGLFIAFFFLRDKDRIQAAAKRFMRALLPNRVANPMGSFFGEVNRIFSGYIRGQLMVSLIMGTLFSIALSLIGVDFAVIIGVFSGIANIIPYFGAIIAFSLTMIAALMSGDLTKAVLAAIAIVILQQVDAMVISPRIVSKSVELSPVLVLVAITAGGKVFGLWGMIFAVPACALLKIFMGRFIEYRLEKTKMKPEKT